MVAPLSTLWANAQDTARAALKRADADVLGTERAQQRYERMTPGERQALERTVVQRYGQPAWSDFMRAVGKEQSDDVENNAAT